jgi:hypothetical protein
LNLWAPGPGGVCQWFDVTFQEPVLGNVRRHLDGLKVAYPGLVLDPEVMAAEISVDFYSKRGSAEERLLMVALLTRHVLPSKELPSTELAGHRWKYGPARKDEIHGLPNNWTRRRDLLRFPFTDLKGIVDSTFYIGENGGPLMWRVMHKILDKQNRVSGSRALLLNEEQRARIEANLRSGPLRSVGVRTLSDLAGMSFVKLQGRLFQFRLPTFADTRTSSKA